MQVSDATIRSVCIEAYGPGKVSDTVLMRLIQYLEHQLGMPRACITEFRVENPHIGCPRDIEIRAENSGTLKVSTTHVFIRGGGSFLANSRK